MTGSDMLEMIRHYDLYNSELRFGFYEDREDGKSRIFQIDKVPMKIDFSNNICLLTGNEE